MGVRYQTMRCQEYVRHEGADQPAKLANLTPELNPAKTDAEEIRGARQYAEGVKKIIKQGGKAVGKAASMPGFGSLSDAGIDALVKLVLGFAGK